MELAPELKRIPSKIRPIRKEKGLTLEKLGKITGLNRISEILELEAKQ